MAAVAAEASLLRFEGVLNAGFLPLAVHEDRGWEWEEVGGIVIEFLDEWIVWLCRAGHRKGRLKSSRLEEDCL